MIFELNEFLEIDDRNKLKILSLFEGHVEKIVAFEELRNVFHFSRFKLNNYVEQLSEEINKYNAFIEIELVPPFKLIGRNITTETFRLLRLDYLENSYVFDMFYELVTSRLVMKNFGKERFLSRSKTYRIKKELERILTHVELRIENNELVGLEPNVRKFIFEVYFNFFNGIKFPFSPLIQKKTNLISVFFSDSTNIDLVPTKKTKLELFIAITILRLEEGNTLKQSIMQLRSLRGVLFSENNTLFEYIKRLHDLSKTETVSEIDFLLAFLIAEDILKVPNIYELGIEDNEIKLLTNEMLSIVGSNLKFLGELQYYDKAIILKNLAQMLFKLHFQYSLYPIMSYKFNPEKQFSFFEEVYPNIYSIAEKFVQMTLDSKIFPQLESSPIVMYHNYILVLIIAIPRKYLRKRIYVCVDFSEGDSYTDYIINSINCFDNSDIEFQKKLTTNTDIYLSDCLYTNGSFKQVIWRNLPLDDDWRVLGVTISEVRRQKSNDYSIY